MMAKRAAWKPARPLHVHALLACVLGVREHLAAPELVNMPAPSFLQTNARSQSSVPSDFFEDAAPTAAQYMGAARSAVLGAQGQDALAPAPYDVGVAAVQAPPAAWSSASYKPLSLVAGPALPPPQISQTFPGEDAAPTQLASSGTPSSMQPPNTLLETENAAQQRQQLSDSEQQQAAMRSNATQEIAQLQAQAADQQRMLEQHLADLQGQLAAERQGPSSAEGAPQERIPALQRSAEQQATSFFEDQGDLAGQEPDEHGASSLAATPLPELTQLAPAPAFPPSPVAGTAQPELSADSAVEALHGGLQRASIGSGTKTSPSNENAMRRYGQFPRQGQTGEQGEETARFQDAALDKLRFPVKPESMLRAEGRVLAEHRKLQQAEQDTQDAFGQLKVATYHSADMSNYRAMDREKDLTNFRRMELLADANQEKAKIAHQSLEQSQALAGLERTAHLSGERESTLRRSRVDAEERLAAEERESMAGASSLGSERADAEEVLRKEQQYRDRERRATSDAVATALAGTSDMGSQEALTIETPYPTAQQQALSQQAADRATLQRYLDASQQSAVGLEQSALYPQQGGTGLTQAQASSSSILGSTLPLAPGSTHAQLRPSEFIQPLASLQNRGVRASGSPSPQLNSVDFRQVPGSWQNSGELASASAPQENSPRLTQGIEPPQNFAGFVQGSTMQYPAGPLPGTASQRTPIGFYQPLQSPSNALGLVPNSHQQIGSELGSTLQKSSLSPEHNHCMPQCRWTCSNPTCDGNCQPSCEAPKCQTRCDSVSTNGCMMECDTPHCAVVCPRNDTALCFTQCGDPQCKLQCPHAQSCRNVCEHPSCDYKCEALVSCPRPECSMACEAPKSCRGSTFASLPPLRPGESSVRSFSAPPDLRQTRYDVSSLSAATSLRGSSLAATSIPTVEVPVETAPVLAERSTQQDTAARASPEVQPLRQQMVTIPVMPPMPLSLMTRP